MCRCQICFVRWTLAFISFKPCKVAFFLSARLHSLISWYRTHIFVFSVDFVVHFFYAVYNRKICRFFGEKTAFVDKPTIGKTVAKTKLSPQKICEISLQHPPHNSHIYNQPAPSSQIREKWATFVSVYLTTFYNNIPKINIHLSSFQSAKALTLCPYLHALVPLLHVNSRTNYCSQQPYFNVLSEKLRFFTLSRASNTRFLHIACLFFSLFSTFSTPVFLSFFRTKKITSLHRHALFGKNRIVEQQMNELRLIVPPCTIRVFARVNFRKFCLSLQVNF